ncbi:DUF6916 family protein [Radicibacter daui]|uniref:DUF6916 family protein n=1 Tax=Radicibacter daui TaxID=3064829 RepID=UPI004046F06F
MQRVEYTHFMPFINNTFTARRAEAQVEMDLLQVSTKTSKRNNYFRENPFTLVFRCALKVILPQGLYNMATAGFEPMDIFITAVGADADGVIYHAVFD